MKSSTQKMNIMSKMKKIFFLRMTKETVKLVLWYLYTSADLGILDNISLFVVFGMCFIYKNNSKESIILLRSFKVCENFIWLFLVLLDRLQFLFNFFSCFEELRKQVKHAISLEFKHGKVDESPAKVQYLKDYQSSWLLNSFLSSSHFTFCFL